ncbi:MAG: hypothetical protein EPGJADBJ_02607 [Saprospiraceae bacterium]|nr:hypothetical protein [Saprospiraceae bacterium]
MKFTKGNLALRDHIKNQKRVFLFTFYKKGAWKYITELELFKDPFEFKTIDKNNDYRKGIKFVFKSLTPISYLNQESQINILEEYTTKYQPIRNKPNETERNGLVNSRVGQGWYRLNILSRWDNKCAVTGCNIPNILIASHIVPWNQATDEERLDIENGILLAPHIDALFDKHLISFNDDGKIIISHRIIPELHSILCINSEMKIYDLSEKNKEYLKRHREVFHSNNSIENRQ